MTLPQPARPSDPHHSHQKTSTPQGRPERKREFPVFGPDHLRSLVENAGAIYQAATLQGKGTLAQVAGRLATQEQDRRPFLRWCWLNRRIAFGGCSALLPETMLAWADAGCPDGMDCCPRCGSHKWTTAVEPEVVPAHTGGVVRTGRMVIYSRCGVPQCAHTQLVDVIG